MPVVKRRTRRATGSAAIQVAPARTTGGWAAGRRLQVRPSHAQVAAGEDPAPAAVSRSTCPVSGSPPITGGAPSTGSTAGWAPVQLRPSQIQVWAGAPLRPVTMTTVPEPASAAIADQESGCGGVSGSWAVQPTPSQVQVSVRVPVAPRPPVSTTWWRTPS